MTSFPEDFKKYAKIKRIAAKRANENREVYIEIKSPLIEEMAKKALNL